MLLDASTEGSAAPGRAGPRLATTLLRGHSGAHVVLHGAGPGAFVRKRAGDPGQNDRLRGQAEKQARFAAAGVAAPPMLRSGLDRGLFFFDMPYVAARSVAAQCVAGSAASLQALPTLVASWMDRTAGTIDGRLPAARVVAKIDAVLAACRGNPILADCQPPIALLGAALRGLDWSGLPRSDCHGDLTLENILAGPDGLTLIDFDVPDLPSLLFDLAKLYQDLHGHWCLRQLAAERGAGLRRLNATMALRRLRREIDAVVEARMPAAATRLPGLVALSLLRTLPYCREAATARYVIERSGAVLADLA